jgi:hypothetical protein
MCLHSNTTQTLAYKKDKNMKKKIPPKKHFFYLYCMPLFSAKAKVFSKKIQVFF